MNDDFLMLNIREYLKQSEYGENILKQVFSTFSCDKNLDVERFLLEQAISFTKKNQSVTYIVLTPEEGEVLGYFTITIKPISVDANNFSNTVKKKIARVSKQDENSGHYSLSAYLIAQLGKNFNNGANKKITGEQLLTLAIEKIKELQYMVDGMVIFLETENNEKLIKFYEDKNGFKRFNIKETKINEENTRTLIQLLKV